MNADLEAVAAGMLFAQTGGRGDTPESLWSSQGPVWKDHHCRIARATILSDLARQEVLEFLDALADARLVGDVRLTAGELLARLKAQTEEG